MADAMPFALESAGQHMRTEVPSATESDTVREALARLRTLAFDSVESLYVTDSGGRLLGIIPLAELLRAADGALIGQLPRSPAVSIAPEADQEQMAILAATHELASVPVVDARGALLGVVPAQALIRILRREHAEDLHRLAGIAADAAPVRVAMEAPPLRRVQQRLPWLLLGLVGSFAATAIMAGFEATLQAKVTVAFFVPAIVYLADAIGTQTEAITVRFLSFQHAPLRTLLPRELLTGLLIGIALGALTVPAVSWVFGDRALAVAVGLSIACAGVMASIVGLTLPWALSSAGVDPAFGSGPVATVIQDVLSLLVYFAIVTAMVGGPPA